MNQGYDALEKGDPRKAAEAFRAADALVHVPTTCFALARAEVALGRLVEAYEALVRLSGLALQGGEPAEFTTARREGEKLRSELEGRIPSLRITVVGASRDAALVVRLDDRAIPNASLDAPWKVNPGHHIVAAEWSGQTRRVEIETPESEERRVSLEFVRAVPASVERSDTKPVGLGPAAVTGIGVAAVGVLAGTVTGLIAIGAKSSAIERGCANNQCPPPAQSDAHRAQTFATISTLSFAVGAVGAAVAVVSLFWPARASRNAVGVGGSGIVGSF